MRAASAMVGVVVLMAAAALGLAAQQPGAGGVADSVRALEQARGQALPPSRPHALRRGAGAAILRPRRRRRAGEPR